MSGFVGKGPFERLKAAFHFALGAIHCLRLIVRLRPACVVGTGGYAAAPACFAAIIARVPLILHEMNYKPGLVTRLLSKRAFAVACAHAETAGMLPSGARSVVTGVPVRPEVEALSEAGSRRRARAAAPAELRVTEGRRTLLVFGGSQGAEALNEAVWQTLPRFRDRGDIQVLHLTGLRDFTDPRRAEVEKALGDAPLLYRALAYWERMELAYSIADLAVTRAGAGTLAELSAACVPAVLVPFPYATAGHQESNAEQFAETGAALLVKQEGSSAITAIERAFALLDDQVELGGMLEAAERHERARSAQGIVDLIEELT